MKKLRLFTLILGITIFGTVTASASTVSIRRGATVSIKSGNLHVKFARVVEDSRCPMNARCIQAGNAKVRLRVTAPGHRTRVVELNSGKENEFVLVFGYRMEFVDLSPWPGDPRHGNGKPETLKIDVTRH